MYYSCSNKSQQLKQCEFGESLTIRQIFTHQYLQIYAEILSYQNGRTTKIFNCLPDPNDAELSKVVPSSSIEATNSCT